MDIQEADNIVKRIRLWVGAAVLLVGVFTGVGATVVARSTSDVRTALSNTHDDLARLAYQQDARAEVDSLRFERAMEVLELAVVAIVEPDGSVDQKGAIDELKRRRHIADVRGY